MVCGKLLLALALLLIAASCTPENDRQDVLEDEAALRALAERALEAENIEDLEAWLETITDDATLLTASGPLSGKDVIRGEFAASFSQYDWEGSWSLKEIEISGDLAVMWGPVETITTERESGERSRSVGYHMDVARRQPDGSWKFTWWTTNQKSVADSDSE